MMLPEFSTVVASADRNNAIASGGLDSDLEGVCDGLKIRPIDHDFVNATDTCWQLGFDPTS
jgi:hypothetical protein